MDITHLQLSLLGWGVRSQTDVHHDCLAILARWECCIVCSARHGVHHPALLHGLRQIQMQGLMWTSSKSMHWTASFHQKNLTQKVWTRKLTRWKISNLTFICFRWVGSTTHQKKVEIEILKHFCCFVFPSSASDRWSSMVQVLAKRDPVKALLNADSFAYYVMEAGAPNWMFVQVVQMQISCKWNVF